MPDADLNEGDNDVNHDVIIPMSNSSCDLMVGETQRYDYASKEVSDYVCNVGNNDADENNVSDVAMSIR